MNLTNPQLQSLLAETFGDKIKVTPDMIVHQGQWFNEIVDDMWRIDTAFVNDCALLVSWLVYESFTEDEREKLRRSFYYFGTDMRFKGYMFAIKEVVCGK